jgi:hypothetical protein
MEVLGVLRRSGITVSTNATPEKKPLKSFDPCPQQKRSPYALHDSYLLERQRVEAGRPLAQWHAHTCLHSSLSAQEGGGQILQSSIRMWMFSAYTMWQAPLLSEARTTMQQSNILTQPSLEKNKALKWLWCCCPDEMS